MNVFQTYNNILGQQTEDTDFSQFELEFWRQFFKRERQTDNRF